MIPRYLVTKGSDNETFLVGDHIIFNKDGTISCIEAQGWIEKEDVESALQGVEYEPDQEYLKQQKARLMSSIEELEELENLLKK